MLKKVCLPEKYMQFNDAVYGQVTVNEPLLLELIQSAPVQRLKGVHQGGARYLVLPEDTITRYDHCMGVMLLLKKFNAPLEEQAAGLLHDVGHTAFSHVIDQVFKEYDYNYDDAHLEKVLESSEIPGILEYHNLDWKRICEKERYPLLEQPLPHLCADRIDYTLRDCKKFLPNPPIDAWLSGLEIHASQFVFKDVQTAKSFTLHYIKLGMEQWAGDLSNASYELLAEAIRYALEEGTLSEKDFYGTDEETMKRLSASKNPRIQRNLHLLTPTLKIKPDSKDYDYFAPNKVRWVDPLVLNGNKKPVALSELNHQVKSAIQAYKEKISKGTYIKILGA